MKNRSVLLCALYCAAFVCVEACGGANDALFSGKHRNPDAGLDASPSFDAQGTGGRPGAVVCKNSLDCVGAPDDRLVCDRAAATCVECVADADCDPDTRCYDNHCRASCTSDRDCTAKGLLCDTSAGHCVECLVNGDCAAHMACMNGSCEMARRPGAAGAADGGPKGTGGASDGGRNGDGGRSNGGRTGSPGASSGGAKGDGGDLGSGGDVTSGGVTGSGGAASGGVAGSGGVAAGGVAGSGGVASGGSAGAGGGGTPSCIDSILNIVTCSAACPCAVGAGCLRPSDCGSGVCTLGTGGTSAVCSAAPTCTNGILDGTETAVDCGGLGCPKCAAGKACDKNADCLSANCASKVCVACDVTKCPTIAAYPGCCRSTGGCGMSIGTLCL